MSEKKKISHDLSINKPNGYPENEAPKYAHPLINPFAAHAIFLFVNSVTNNPINICGLNIVKPMKKRISVCNKDVFISCAFNKYRK